MTSLRARLGWGVLALLAIGIAFYAVPPYLLLNPALSRIKLNPAVSLHLPILAMHAVGGGLALVLGPFQFLAGIRRTRPQVHHWLGRIYLLGVLLGGVAAVFSAVVSTSGFVAQTGFLCLAGLWLFSGYRAYAHIRHGHIRQHQQWMVRNYALTFAAVILRIWLGVGIAFLLPQLQTTYHGHFSELFAQVYSTAAWLCWSLPLVAADWFFNQRLNLKPIPETIAQQSAEQHMPVPVA